MNRKTLDVYYHDSKVGTLAELEDHRIAFEYDKKWLIEGFSISPLSLPLNPGVFIPKSFDPFDGLFGVFAHSLPDGWGALLTDRMLRSNGVDPAMLSALDRLAITGKSGKGALEYRPSLELKSSFNQLSADESFDYLAKQCQLILEDQISPELDLLYENGGSSGGARPKVLVELNGESWIIKFRTAQDPDAIGLQEAAYMTCARHCGIEVPDFQMFSSNTSPGYFGVKRFDRREDDKKIHMVSAAALLETSHRIPNLDYTQLLKLTWILCQDMEEMWKLFRLMCFNVFAHNRDDHSNNFSWLYDGNGWYLSPAYDLTFSNSIGGEHATMIAGNGKDPGEKDLLRAAKTAGLDLKEAKKVIRQIQSIVHEELKEWIK